MYALITGKAYIRAGVSDLALVVGGDCNSRILNPADMKTYPLFGDGVGAAIWNVGSSGDAFGVANNTSLTVMDLLLATDDQAITGLLYNGTTARRNEANPVYSALN
jgi:3-oxoacyl-[acyl-carrier-protein] synthase III